MGEPRVSDVTINADIMDLEAQQLYYDQEGPSGDVDLARRIRQERRLAALRDLRDARAALRAAQAQVAALRKAAHDMCESAALANADWGEGSPTMEELTIGERAVILLALRRAARREEMLDAGLGRNPLRSPAPAQRARP